MNLQRLFIALLLIISTTSLALAGGRKPIKLTPKDKCPVCGMFVAKYPDFEAQVLFKDGSYAVFDGAKDMFKYYLEIHKYNKNKNKADIDSIYVTDYYTLKLIDGYAAYYVTGSDIMGPMGHELIGFVKQADAAEFKKDHKGNKIIRFKDVTISLVGGLD
jgi:copper chaperone NosL